MTVPPKYPRVPHVASSSAVTADDRILSVAERAALLRAEVVIEEKLDGMNVMLWIEGGVPRVGTRGGADTSDRSGERGRVQRWAGMHADALIAGLGEDRALYGEWLRRRHIVPYEHLPAELLGLDILDRSAGRFLALEDRDALLEALGVAAPPRRFTGRLTFLARLDEFFGTPAFGDASAEGLIVRTVDGGAPRVAKRVDPVWSQVGSAEWLGENRVSVTGATT